MTNDLSKRSQQFLDGHRNAVKWAIALLHARADAMVDPRAKAILNVAASEIGAIDKNRRFLVEASPQLNINPTDMREDAR